MISKVGDAAVKVSFLRVRPGWEFDVVKQLKRQMKHLHINDYVILKEFGYWDIILIYLADDFDHYFTKAGPIEGILSSLLCLCFPYLWSTAKQIIRGLKASTFAGLVLIKWDTESMQSIKSMEQSLVNYLGSNYSHSYEILGTIGWNEIILIIKNSKLEDLITETHKFNYRKNDRVSPGSPLKTFSHLGIIFDKLFPKGFIIEDRDPTKVMNEHQDFLENQLHLNTPIVANCHPTINISALFSHCQQVRAFWESFIDNPFGVLETLGEFDLLVFPKRLSDGDMTWAYFLSRLLCFRRIFKGKVNDTYTSFSWQNDYETGKMKNLESINPVFEASALTLNPMKFFSFDFKTLEKDFGPSAVMLANHFFTLNGLAQHCVNGNVFQDLMLYPERLVQLGKEVKLPSADMLAFSSSLALAVGAEIRSYGTHGNIEKSFSHFSKLNGGVQRSLLAIELLPHHIFRRLKSKWYGFIITQDPKFSHYNEIIMVPSEALWMPSMWWAIYHETAHILIERTKWLSPDEYPLVDFFKNKADFSKNYWLKLIIELYAEVIGYQLGFFGERDLYLDLLWGHLIKIDTVQKKRHPLSTYLVRSFFVELYDRMFLRNDESKISKVDFLDRPFLYQAFMDHINNIEKRTGMALLLADEGSEGEKSIKNENRSYNYKKISFVSANTNLFKELFPVAEHLYKQIRDTEKRFGITIQPKDMRTDQTTKSVLRKLVRGEVYWDNIEHLESILFEFFVKMKERRHENQKSVFKSEIAGILTFWNAALQFDSGGQDANIRTTRT